MTDLIAAGGSLSYAVLGLGALGALVALALGGIGFRKKRVPLVFFVAVPMLVVLIGAVGAWMNAGSVYDAIAAAEPDAIPGVAMAGLWDALSIDVLSRWIAAFVFALCAWGASLGALAAGDDTQRTLVSGVLAAVVTLGGALLIAGYGIYTGVGGSATVLAALFVFAGLGVAAGSFKRALDEQAHRVAGMRFASSICMLLAISYGSRALVMNSRMDALGPNGVASQGHDLMQSIGLWAELAAPISTLGWLAMAAALGVAFFGFFNELGEVVEWYTLLDVFATAALATLVGVSRFVESRTTDSLLAIGTHRPATELFADKGGDLQGALITVDGAAKEVAPIPGGFGDVFVYKDEKLTRTHKWTGTGWDADETGIEEATISDLRPLIVIGSGDEAAQVVSVLEKSKDGEALLLMRASEVKSDVEVPSELAHLQVAFLSVKLGGERDLEKELWQKSGEKDYMWGPVYWYGDTDAEEPLAYAAAVSEATGAVGLHILLSERARVKDIAGGCLPWITDGSGDELVNSEDHWCVVSTDDPEDVRAAAVEVWEPPQPENTTMVVTKVEGDQLDEELVIDRLMWEAGAIDFCVNYVREEGEEGTVGKMLLELWVNKKGKIGTVQLHEKTRLETPVVARCAAMRFKRVEFPWPEDYEPPEVPEGEDPPPMPHYEIALDLREPRG